jgi:hypothetical protein
MLIDDRTNGAIWSMILSLPLGFIFMYFFTKMIMRFPGMDLAAIFKESFLPIWLGKIIIILLSLIWATSGVITLITFTDITHRFINPDMSGIYINLLFILFVVWATTLATEKVLYLLEIILVLNGPLILFLFLKAFFSESISWSEIMEAGTYVKELPTWASLSAATYMFSGYANLVVFNKVFTKKISTKWFWLLIPIGITNIFTTYFIPIGVYGFQGVGELTYPWLSSADALRINLAFIERVFFVFVLVYVGISLINVILHWHVGMKLILSVISNDHIRKPQPKEMKLSIKYYIKKWMNLRNFILLLFASLVLGLEYYFNEAEIFTFTEWWMQIRMPMEYAGALLVIIIGWRKKS